MVIASDPAKSSIVVHLLNSVYSLVRIYQKVIAKCDSRSLLVRVAFPFKVVKMLLVEIVMPLLPVVIALLFVLLWRWAHVLAVSHFVLPFVWLEAVEDIPTKLQVDVDRHLIGIA